MDCNTREIILFFFGNKWKWYYSKTEERGRNPRQAPQCNIAMGARPLPSSVYLWAPERSLKSLKQRLIASFNCFPSLLLFLNPLDGSTLLIIHHPQSADPQIPLWSPWERETSKFPFFAPFLSFVQPTETKP